MKGNSMGRKILLVCCLVAFCVGTFAGCTPAPGKNAPANTTGKAKSAKKA
jgi:hypothetical protein